MRDNFPGRSLPFAIALLFLCAGVSAAIVPAAPSEYLTDNTGVLSKEGAAILNGKLAAFARETSKPLLVYVDRHLPAGATLEAFGSEALHTWRIGDRALDNGAILVVFVEDRKLRIAVGRGLRPTLSDAEAERIVKDLIGPRFKAEAYERGIDEGVQAMMTAVRSGKAVGTDTSGGGTSTAIAATSTAGTIALQNTLASDGPSPSQRANAPAVPNIGKGGRRASTVPEGSNGGSSDVRDGATAAGGILLVPVIVFIVGLIVWLGRDQSPDVIKRSSRASVDDVATTAALFMITENSTQHTPAPPVYQPPAPPVDTSSSGGDFSGGSSGGDGGASGSW